MPFRPFRLSFIWPQLSIVPMGTGGIGQCCATGSFHTGTPTGREEEHYGLNMYIAEPKGILEPKGVVVILPDIFGWTLPNNRILADEMARKGPFVVILPDLMNGFVVPPSLMTSFKVMASQGFLASIKKIYHTIRMMYWFVPFRFRNGDSAVRSRLHQFLEGVREDYPDLPVGAAGYCWGGKYTVELCAGRNDPNSHQPTDPEKGLGNGKPLVVCGFTAHPSRVDFPADIEAVQLPLSVAAAGERDPMMTRGQGEMTKRILEEKTQQAKDAGSWLRHEFVWYEGAHHGFAVRADGDDRQEAQRGKKAETQAIRWLGRCFDVARRNMRLQ